MDYIVRPIDNLFKVQVLDVYMAGHKGFIAGGCFKNLFNNEHIKDIDIFFRSEIDFIEAQDHFKTDQDYIFYYENKKVYAFKNTKTNIIVELIKSNYGEPQDIIDIFDFSITKFAYYKEINVHDVIGEESIEYKVIHHKDYFEHLFFKRLVLDKDIRFPVSTFERSLRYKRYGYGLCKESKSKLIKAIKESELSENITESLYDGMD